METTRYTRVATETGYLC